MFDQYLQSCSKSKGFLCDWLCIWKGFEEVNLKFMLAFILSSELCFVCLILSIVIICSFVNLKIHSLNNVSSLSYTSLCLMFLESQLNQWLNHLFVVCLDIFLWGFFNTFLYKMLVKELLKISIHIHNFSGCHLMELDALHENAHIGWKAQLLYLLLNLLVNSLMVFIIVEIVVLDDLSCIFFGCLIGMDCCFKFSE